MIKIIKYISKDTIDKGTAIQNLSKTVKDEIEVFYKELHAKFEAHGKIWKGCIDNLWAVGPKGVNNNILVNNIPGYERRSIWEGLVEGSSDRTCRTMREYDNSVITGFQLAVQSGPICEEPLMGVAFFVEDWRHEGK